MKSWTAILALAACLLAPVATPAPADTGWTDTVKLAVLAYRPKPETEARWRPLTDYLSGAVPGHRFELLALTYTELEAAIATRRVDFVFTQPSHYVLIAERMGLSSPLATLIDRAGERPVSAFGGVLFTRADRRDIAHLTDVRGKRLATGTMASLGGYQAQALALLEAGVRVPEQISLTVTGPPHDRAVMEVLEGRADVGMVRSGVIEAMAAEGKLDPARLKILNRQDLPDFPFAVSTRLYPEWPLSAMPHVRDDLARATAAALMSLPLDSPAARAMSIHGFTIPADYRPVEALMRTLRAPPFDATPDFTAGDIWQRYHWLIVGLIVAGAVILLLVVALLTVNRRLRQGERLRGTVLEALAEGVVMQDASGRVVTANGAAARILGLTPEQMRGRDSLDPGWSAIHENGEDFPDDTHPATVTLRTGEPCRDVVMGLRKPDGEVTWIAINTAPLRHSGEREPYAVVASFIDISARKRMDAELANVRQQVLDITQSIPVAVYRYRLDANGRPQLLYIGNRVESLFGITAAEALRDPARLFERIHPDDFEAFRAADLAAWRSGAPFVHELRYFGANGETRWLHLESVPRAMADGSRVYNGFMQDITAQKQAAAALAESDLRFRQFADSSDLVFWLRTDDQMLYISKAYESVWGRSCQSLYENPASFLDSVHPDDLDRVRAAFAAVRAEGVDFDQEYRIVRADGSIRWIHARSHAVPGIDGSGRRWAGNAEDITETKQVELALREKTADLERSNADLEQFAYAISHDMRQPLRMVSGHLQLLERALGDRLEGDERANLQYAVDGARRMDAMIQSLLDYSRVGRGTDPKAWLDSREPLDEALDFLAPAIAEHHAEVAVTGDWPRLHASRDELTRLFQNLIGNAIKYHEPDARPRARVDSTVVGRVWRVVVSDNGIGIDPAQIRRLFQFYSRLQSRARFDGTGMGLALSRRIVEHHHGRIRAESAGAGHGSTFTFEIPLPDPADGGADHADHADHEYPASTTPSPQGAPA